MSVRQEDLVVLLHMLTDALQGQNSHHVLQQLEAYNTNPVFCQLLCAVFGVSSPCVSESLPLPWEQYRSVAGLTLKNSVRKSKLGLGEDALRSAAHASYTVVSAIDSSLMLARVAAHILACIMSCTSPGWWISVTQTNLLQQLIEQLRSDRTSCVQAALYALQYLLEDAAFHVGGDAELVLQKAAEVGESGDTVLRRHAFHVLSQVYAQGGELDWDVDHLSPLQQSLCNASVHVARLSTNLCGEDGRRDSRVMCDVLSTLRVLLEYMESFAMHVPEHIFVGWVDAAAEQIAAGPGGPEVMAAACDFLTEVVAVDERTESQGAIRYLSDALRARCAALVPLLFPAMVLVEEDVKVVLSTDHFSHRDACTKRSTLRQRCDSDETNDDGVPQSTLRRAVSECLDHLCQLHCEAVLPCVLELVHQRWTDADWRTREVAMLALGAMWTGAYYKLLPYAESLVPQLIDRMKEGTSEHVFVVAMATWTCSRFLHWLATLGAAHLAAYVHALLNNLTSESKLIQLSALTAVRNASFLSRQEGIAPFMLPFQAIVVETVIRCVPNYHTTNLAVLADVSIHLVLSSESQHDALGLVQAFMSTFQHRMDCFGESFGVFYGENSEAKKKYPAGVEKDVFDVARVIYTFLQKYLLSEEALRHLEMWTAVLSTIAARSLQDDGDLTENPLNLCALLVGACPTSALGYFTQLGPLLQATLVLLTFDSPSVRGSAAQLLRDLLRILPVQCLHHLSIDTAARALLVSADATVHPELACDAAGTARALVEAAGHCTAAHTATLHHLIHSIAAQIRSDTFGYTLDLHTRLALCVGAMWAHQPTAATRDTLTAVLVVLKQGSNNDDKADATIGVCQVMHAWEKNQAEVPPFNDVLQHFMRFVYSWQRASEDSCRQAIASTLHLLQRTSAQALSRLMEDLPVAYRLDTLQHYGLSAVDTTS